MRLLLQSSAAQPLTFLLVQSSDHITPLTGATPTVTISQNGGSFVTPSGAVSEIGNGWYQVAGNATDTGTLGPLILHATADSGDPTDREYEVVAFDPQSGTNLGLSGLATANPGASGGMAVVGSQMDLVDSPNATAVTAIQSGLATSTNITDLQTHGDSTWATATGFATAAALSTLSTAIGNDFSSLQSHGDSNWSTATGFALAGSAPGWYTAPDNTDIASLIASVGSSLGTHVSSILTIVGTSGVVVGGASITSIQSGLATSSGLSALQTHGDSNWSTATGFAVASIWTSGLASTISTNLDTNVGSRAAPGDAMTLASSEDIYPATIDLTIDNADTQDEYTVCWFQNGTPVTTGITNPLIQVVDRGTGSNLIASTSMVQVGSTGTYKHDEPTNRITDGDAYIVQVSATINGNSRTWQQIVSRDG